MRYIITINRSLLESQSQAEGDKRPILVRDTETGEETAHKRVEILTGGSVVFGPPQQNGATVWVEAELIEAE